MIIELLHARSPWRDDLCDLIDFPLERQKHPGDAKILGVVCGAGGSVQNKTATDANEKLPSNWSGANAEITLADGSSLRAGGNPGFETPASGSEVEYVDRI